jgi:hypothetical protein
LCRFRLHIGFSFDNEVDCWLETCIAPRTIVKSVESRSVALDFV